MFSTNQALFALAEITGNVWEKEKKRRSPVQNAVKGDRLLRVVSANIGKSGDIEKKKPRGKGMFDMRAGEDDSD